MQKIRKRLDEIEKIPKMPTIFSSKYSNDDAQISVFKKIT